MKEMAEQDKGMTHFAPSYQMERSWKAAAVCQSWLCPQSCGTQLIFGQMNSLKNPKGGNAFLPHLPVFFEVYWFLEVRPWNRMTGWPHKICSETLLGEGRRCHRTGVQGLALSQQRLRDIDFPAGVHRVFSTLQCIHSCSPNIYWASIGCHTLFLDFDLIIEKNLVLPCSP